MKKVWLLILAVPILFIGLLNNTGTNILTNKSYVELKDTKRVTIPVLMYHHFTEDETKGNNTTVTKEEFNEQMQTLVDNGYTAITDKELIDFYKEGKVLPEKPIHITMDDGYTSNYEIAYPILKEKQLKATIFTVISQVGKQPGYNPHFTWEQAKEMSESGIISIQSHTYDLHDKVDTFFGDKAVLLVGTNKEKKEEHYQTILEDFIKSREEIKKHTGIEPISLSFPYGKYNKESIKALKEAGYDISYTIKKGVNDKTTHRYTLKRINVPHGWSGTDITNKIDKFN